MDKIIYHRTIKTKLFYVKLGTHIDFGVENNDKGSQLEVGDYVRTSKYKTVFAPSQSEKIFLTQKS